jgi:carbonic anhydrase
MDGGEGAGGVEYRWVYCTFEGECLVSVVEALLENNRRYAENFSHRNLPIPPSLGVAVVACMDARLSVYDILGLRPGQAHVLRNAGGVVTEDVLRSLVISQRLLGTRTILLVHHTDCGMLTFRDDELKEKVQREVGIRPPFAFESFSNLEEDVRQSIRRVRVCPFLPHTDDVHGFVYDVATGLLREVT